MHMDFRWKAFEAGAENPPNDSTATPATPVPFTMIEIDGTFADRGTAG